MMNSASRRRLRFAVLLFGLTISFLLGILCVAYVYLLFRDFDVDPTRRVSNAIAGIFGFGVLIALTVVTAAFAIEVGIPARAPSARRWLSRAGIAFGLAVAGNQAVRLMQFIWTHWP
jgi:hypothetical protein